MAGSVQAKIDVIIGGLREVAALEGRLEAIQSTITAINKAPVDLNVGGRGRSRDLSGKLSKNVNDLVRNFDNFGKSFSSVNKQATLFGDLMSQTALKSTGEFKRQDVAVKNLATAYTTATREAARFERQQINLIRTSKGLQTSTQREIEVLRRRAKVSRLQERRRRGQNLQQDLALGVGFPLLFGGGPGAVLGGAAGAIAGGGKGGFGLQVLGSAVGQQFDAFARVAAETGVALTSTSGALELMRDKSLFSSDAARERAAVLEELGQVEELAAHLTQEMALAIGNNGVNSLQGLGDATKETTRLWNLLTTQLVKLISGPLQGFLNIVNQVLGGITGAASREAFFGDLGTQETAARARFKELTGESLGTGRSGAQKRAAAEAQGRVFLSQEDALAQIRKEFQPQVTAKIPVTAQDRRDITAGGAGRRSRIPDLNAEIGLQERLLTLNSQIAQAKRDENPVREAALQMEVAMEQQAAKRAIIDAKRIPEAEKILEKQLLELQTDQEILNIQNRLKDIRATEAEKAQQTIDGLLAEQALLQATLEGRREEEELNQRVAQIMKDNPKLEEEKVRKILEGSAAIREQISLQDQLGRVYENIGMSIKTGVVDSISAAVDGTKSLAEVASNTLKNIANQLLNIGVNFALFGVPFGMGGGGGLLGGLFANGGRPPVGKPSIVGERGPELFVPRSSGTIVPNHALGGSANVTVNVDASGSSVQGSGNEAAQLGKAIGLAVQQELIKQKRPGGLLTT